VCIYFLIIFVGTVIVAPRLHATAQFLFQEVSWRFGRLAGQPFYRFLYGTFTLLAVVALPALLKALRIPSINALGLKPGLRHVGEGIQGLVWGLISFLLLTAVLVASNIRVFDAENSARLVANFKNLIFASVALAFFAELIFRGAFFTAFRRNHRFGAAAFSSALFCALLFLLEKPQNQQRVDWTTGFEALGQTLAPLTESQTLLPALLNLTLFGVLLALAFERTGALHFSVGLHAGVIFCFKSFGLLTNSVSKDPSSFWGSDKLIDGWATTGILLLVFLLIERTLPPRKLIES
jgi:membrane protease YdiL (CAAX protease family)